MPAPIPRTLRMISSAWCPGGCLAQQIDHQAALWMIEKAQATHAFSMWRVSMVWLFPLPKHSCQEP